MTFIWLILAALGVYVATRAWFWAVAFFLIALGSLFSMLASIIHFQILGAIGFFFLMSISWMASFWIIDKKYI